ncbi:hypothetical protein Q765_16275 [Flavobacterium rivuli WB 3.3-2 = DSM 21788]|uniref:ParB-like N-terminal domain-containing protein n=1 Tax=Flavobacterium rivuli WB 3.3-2 = DSM 21788 TaxID=1121895 RepID=A0A0A2M1R6_9FLAO|nr:ParB/Srx family N-terminal domain-containing protein [Flavobacterium rivuli]KGO85423.1 hypothetical protein Q765_16275 [Flavobacterium rivuli WB 3.3-2 = DSM 21788]
MNTVQVPLDKLFLDPNNYRLRSKQQYTEIQDLTDDKLIGLALQQRTFNIVTGKNNIEVKDLIDSFKSNGFLKVDNILVRELGNKKGYVVIEGNRRVAALKILQKSFNEGFNIGILNESIFQAVEAVKYSYNNPEEYLILMGLRHVSGNKKWDRYNQAKLISELSSNGLSVNEIANKLGVANKNAIQQQLESFYAIDAFINDEAAYDSISGFNPYEKFMIFVEVLLKRNVKNWLKWDPTKKEFLNKENLQRFYTWITPAYNISNNEDDDDDEFDYNNSEILEPIIVNHKVIRDLNDIIDDEESLLRLEESRNIAEAIEQNEGFTKKKFSKEIANAEKILKNIKFGPSLQLEDGDKSSLLNIQKIVKRIIGDEN